MRETVLFLAALAAIPTDLPFSDWLVSHGVKVDIARVRVGPPWLRSTAELPAKADAVFSVATDFRHFPEIFSPALKKATVLAAGEDSARLHLVWPYPFPLRNRDAIVAYRIERANDLLRVTWTSDARPGDPAEGVRIERVLGETRVEPVGPERCRVTYTYLGELGGKFPAWVEDRAWREEPIQYIRALRRRLRIPDPPSE